MLQSKHIVHTTSRLLYLIVAITIAAISLLLIGYGITEVWDVIHGASKDIIDKLLDAIGIVVISLALFDVAKYLMEEEVLKTELLPKTKEDLRQTLIKFLSIIAIAISLEALVFIIRVGKTDVTHLSYPIALLVASVAVVIGLGVFIRISKETHSEQT